MSYKGEKFNGVYFSHGNTKTGNIPSTSLLPGKDCLHNCPRCYDLKAVKRFPCVLKTRENNSKILREKPDIWKKANYLFLEKRKPRMFRWNIGGDIISKDHFRIMCDIAKNFPETRFLVFTKSFCFITGKIPKNLSVICSLFPGMRQPKRLSRLPRAYIGEHKGKRFKNAISCHGHCDACGMCWSAREKHIDVKLNWH